MARLAVRFAIGLGGASLASLAIRKKTEDLSAVRLGRAALTALNIGYAYQSKLYSQQWDRSSDEYKALRSEVHQTSAEKLLELCRANKGVYIKVGQHLGALDYLLPCEYVHTMRVLHKSAPITNLEDLFQVIREDTHREPTEIFSEFDPEPLGTASLAQVHRAKLMDGTVVAVKIQHRFVKNNFQIDLKCMEVIIKTMSRVFPDFHMQWLFDETKKNITRELNFLQEGANAEKVSELFREYTWLKVPKIMWEYSTERVLVMEYFEGSPVHDLKYIKKNKIDRFELSRKIGSLYAQMIFVLGFVHSDPHPGNILVRKGSKDKEVTVCLLDHGLYADLTDEFRFHYSKLWLAILARDTNLMRVHAEALGIRNELHSLFAVMVTGRPWESIMKGIDRTRFTKREKNIFENALPEYLHQATECLEQVDRQALLVLKTNDLIRCIEFKLQTHERMGGFRVMTKCCMESIYNIEYKEAKSSLQRTFLSCAHMWSLLSFYMYACYINLLVISSEM